MRGLGQDLHYIEKYDIQTFEIGTQLQQRGGGGLGGSGGEPHAYLLGGRGTA